LNGGRDADAAFGFTLAGRRGHRSDRRGSRPGSLAPQLCRLAQGPWRRPCAGNEGHRAWARLRTFHITFQKGDDPAAGLAEFARKNNLTNAHFEAIGAFGSAVIGWSDRPKKAFKVVRINEEMEVAAFNGNIVRNADGQPVVHAHCAVGILSSEKVYVGHCLQEEVSLTLQVYVTDNGPMKAASN
jgi:hypothetical protein